MHTVMTARLEEAEGEIQRLDPNRMLNTPTDDLVTFFVQKFEIDVPQLRREEAGVGEAQEIDIERSDYGREVRLAGTLVQLTVPFDGDAEMFRVQPTTYDTTPPRAMVVGQSLIIHFAGHNPSPGLVDSVFNSALNDLGRWLDWSRRDAEEFNSRLATHARKSIENRKERLLRDRDLAASLSFKMRARPDAPKGFAAPEIRRKLRPQLPPAPSAAFEPEPALLESDYKHILSVVESMTHVMERSPTTFSEMREEDIRQLFLMQLNGHYEGAATGETFNHKGKTDILIRVDDRNIFIAECKFWAGEKSFLATIDQILAYLSWRDTKAAIIVFNRNKGFSQVLEKIKAATDTHPNKKRGPTVEGESRFRYVFGSQNDPSREIILTVLAFDVPAP